MAKDAELDRLKAAQDRAFQRKQDAWQTMQQAWERRVKARDALNQAHEAKQRAYAVQDSSWQEYQRTRSSNGPRIERLNAQQETAHQNRVRAAENGKAAYNRGDGAMVKQYSEERLGYKEESERYVAERRRLVEEIRTVRSQHEATKLGFQQAKDSFRSVKRTFDQAKAEHERAQADFKKAKADSDQAVSAFKKRLEVVRTESKRRKDDKRLLAEKAGIPYQYRDNVWTSTDASGNTNLYFGGVGEPNGPGHGHYVMDRSGRVTYKRDPFDPHGGQNFTSAQQDYTELIVREAATGDFGFWCRFRGYHAYVESNINTQGRPKIDIYYGPNGPFGPGHHHAVAHREAPFDFVSDQLR